MDQGLDSVCWDEFRPGHVGAERVDPESLSK